MAAEDFYRYLRRRISKCEPVDSLYVMWAYSQYLQVHSFRFPDNIEKHTNFRADSRADYLLHEWELESVASEIVLHARGSTKSMRDWSTFAQIINRVRWLENELYSESGDRDGLIELARIVHRQFPWQQFRPSNRFLYRHYRIYSTSEIDSICHRIIGMSVDALYCQALIASSQFAQAPALDLDSEVGRALKPLIAFTGQPFAEFEAQIKSAHALDHSYAYQVGPIRQFPLIQVESPEAKLALCPLPTLLTWRITSALYYDLIKAAPDFGNALGKSFELYVGAILERAISSPSLRFAGEAAYGTRNRPKATSDWLLIEGDAAAVFIECKTKRPSLAAKTALDDLSALEQDIGKLADAVVQLYERIRDYSDGLFPILSYVPDRKCYPLVVTLEEWYLISPRVQKMLDEAVEARMRTRGLDLGWLEAAPYSAVSVDDFESVSQLINSLGLIVCFEGKVRDPERRQWPLSNHLRDLFSTEWNNTRPLFRAETDEMYKRLAGLAESAGSSALLGGEGSQPL